MVISNAMDQNPASDHLPGNNKGKKSSAIVTNQDKAVSEVK